VSDSETQKSKGQSNPNRGPQSPLRDSGETDTRMGLTDRRPQNDPRGEGVS